MIRVSRVHFPVTVLGPGIRLGIWLQGCSRHCSGCVSKDTWSPEGGTWIEVEELIVQCRQMVPGKIDGITLTGGEPFEQPDALSELLDRIDGWRREESLDILCYSGMPVRHLITKHKAIVDRLDALIPEEFRDDLPTEAAWRGSSNQPLLLLSELAQRRYHEPSGQRPRMQVALGEKDLWMIGIPRRGDLQRLQELSNKHGLQLEEASWL